MAKPRVEETDFTVLVKSKRDSLHEILAAFNGNSSGQLHVKPSIIAHIRGSSAAVPVCSCRGFFVVRFLPIDFSPISRVRMKVVFSPRLMQSSRQSTL
jgi:hypothetical protein